MVAGFSAFADPKNVASYEQNTFDKVPGLIDLHRMSTILLGEHAGANARILVVGAGGGLELRSMAQAQSDWRFFGVDPSDLMLDMAKKTTEPYKDRIELMLGTVEQVPDMLFDGAICLLTLHFLNRSERLQTLKEIRKRLKPGSVFVTAHHTAMDNSSVEWLSRSNLFADRSNNTVKATLSAENMAKNLCLLSPSEEETMMCEAGFKEPALFYAAFSFRGWVTRSE